MPRFPFLWYHTSEPRSTEYVKGSPSGAQPKSPTVVTYSLACLYWLFLLPYFILLTPPLLLLDTTFQINYLNPSPYLGG